MKILITGGLGFIGSHLVAKLGQSYHVDIVDGFSSDYVGYKYIHRGSRGLELCNEIEQKHRSEALKYRLNLISGKYKTISRYDSFIKLPEYQYDLIINCGALSEAILSQHFPEYTYQSIYSGLECVKKFYPNTPVLHISSSMVYGTWEGVIDEQYSLGAVDHYGDSKTKAETLCGKDDIILRPIHVYGMGDGKFSIWMNLERQLAFNKPFMLEAASCIYIDDFVLAIKNILDNWKPGIYNISYDFIRSIEPIKDVYPKNFEYKIKSGPTGKPRGSLDSTKLLHTFGITFLHKDYESTIKDYYEKYENFCQKQ
tara:strand:+ start:1608 stop:2543 length:936 start_codon:yes stop_codon:yes gene_type:complete